MSVAGPAALRGYAFVRWRRTGSTLTVRINHYRISSSDGCRNPALFLGVGSGAFVRRTDLIADGDWHEVPLTASTPLATTATMTCIRVGFGFDGFLAYPGAVIELDVDARTTAQHRDPLRMRHSAADALNPAS
ncbi:hypothetical protein KXS11_09970 [Plantibacter flavus]|uniref:hypothetical protein n=1 Tax=Plantibacter flavus TaxID=150123 RepID=UPI003F1611E3